MSYYICRHIHMISRQVWLFCQWDNQCLRWTTLSMSRMWPGRIWNLWLSRVDRESNLRPSRQGANALPRGYLAVHILCCVLHQNEYMLTTWRSLTGLLSPIWSFSSTLLSKPHYALVADIGHFALSLSRPRQCTKTDERERQCDKTGDSAT